MEASRGLAGRLSGPDRAALARILDILAVSAPHGSFEATFFEGAVSEVRLTTRARPRRGAKTLSVVDEAFGPAA